MTRRVSAALPPPEGSVTSASSWPEPWTSRWGWSTSSVLPRACGSTAACRREPVQACYQAAALFESNVGDTPCAINPPQDHRIGPFERCVVCQPRIDFGSITLPAAQACMFEPARAILRVVIPRITIEDPWFHVIGNECPAGILVAHDRDEQVIQLGCEEVACARKGVEAQPGAPMNFPLVERLHCGLGRLRSSDGVKREQQHRPQGESPDHVGPWHGWRRQ